MSNPNSQRAAHYARQTYTGHNTRRHEPEPTREEIVPLQCLGRGAVSRQCQYAESAADKPRCEAKATRKWGEHWFCDEHGRRGTHTGV